MCKETCQGKCLKKFQANHADVSINLEQMNNAPPPCKVIIAQLEEIQKKAVASLPVQKL